MSTNMFKNSKGKYDLPPQKEYKFQPLEGTKLAEDYKNNPSPQVPGWKKEFKSCWVKGEFDSDFGDTISRDKVEQFISEELVKKDICELVKHCDEKKCCVIGFNAGISKAIEILKK